jgi:hypothetical protein
MSFSLLLSLAMAASQPSFTVWPEGERGRFTVARGQLKLTALLRCPWATQSATPQKWECAVAQEIDARGCQIVSEKFDRDSKGRGPSLSGTVCLRSHLRALARATPRKWPQATAQLTIKG